MHAFDFSEIPGPNPLDIADLFAGIGETNTLNGIRISGYVTRFIRMAMKAMLNSV